MTQYSFLIHYPFLTNPLQVSIQADSLWQATLMAGLQAAPLLDREPGSMEKQDFPEPYPVLTWLS